MKKILFLLLLSIFASCQEKFNPDNFKGSWISLDSNESFNEVLPVFSFKKDSIYLSEIYTYGLKGKYELKNNNIKFFFKKDTFQHSFKYDSKDSSIYIKENRYVNYPGFLIWSDFIDYNLLDLKKEKNITSDSLFKFDNGFHLFKDSNDSLKLKLNDKITSNFNMIPRFVIGHHQFKFNGSVIYLDEKLIVGDLIKCYVKLWQVNIKSHLLITGYDLKTNLYSGFKDRIEFWQEQVDSIVDERMEPIRSKVITRKQYLKKYSPKSIYINSKNDIYKLETLEFKNNYLIQINKDMSIESYTLLKEKILQIKNNQKIRIRTEFNLPL
jgi:hypothetical protein